MLVSFVGLLGNIHPAVVHLPIGILFIACIYKVISVKRKTADNKSLLRLTLFIGFAKYHHCAQSVDIRFLWMAATIRIFYRSINMLHIRWLL